MKTRTKRQTTTREWDKVIIKDKPTTAIAQQARMEEVVEQCVTKLEVVGTGRVNVEYLANKTHIHASNGQKVMVKYA